MQKRKIHFLILVFLIAFGLSFLGTTMAAWQSPPNSPPSGNVVPPVNLTSTTQVKNGSLGIGAVSHGQSVGLQIDNGYFWPRGGLKISNGYNGSQNYIGGVFRP